MELDMAAYLRMQGYYFDQEDGGDPETPLSSSELMAKGVRRAAELLHITPEEVQAQLLYGPHQQPINKEDA